MRPLLALSLFLSLSLPGVAAAQDADPWFGTDKGLHFSASLGLAAGGYGLGAVIFDDAPARVLSGAAVGLGAGVAKELADLAGLGDPSWRDFAWDLVGTAVGVTLSWLIDRAITPDCAHRRCSEGSPTNR